MIQVISGLIFGIIGLSIGVLGATDFRQFVLKVPTKEFIFSWTKNDILYFTIRNG